MPKLYVHHALSDNVEVEKIASIYVPKDTVYFIAKDMSLQDYAQEYKNELYALKKRYAYLERGRNWVVRNLRKLKDVNS